MHPLPQAEQVRPFARRVICSERSEHLPVTRQAVAKHLVVLDRVGLVHATTGGEKQFRVDQARLADIGAGRRDDPVHISAAPGCG